MVVWQQLSHTLLLLLFSGVVAEASVSSRAAHCASCVIKPPGHVCKHYANEVKFIEMLFDSIYYELL